jgi:threonine aldolase
MQINLISDTFTQPDNAMKKAMLEAELGDDVFSRDPTVNRLQDMAAEMFGKEAALYCPSGTMTNQIAIKMHTQPLDELICEELSHVYQYETGGYAFNASVAVNLIRGEHGKMRPEQLEAAIKPVYDWLPLSRLVVLENSTNKGGGNYYELEEIHAIKQICDKHRLKLHLDGSRLFNVLVETAEDPLEIGKLFDSISICLSKGLGAPVGSVLIGGKEDIVKARRFRKVMGGGMRQAGILAAAGIYALENNIQRLADDNARARELGQCLEQLDSVASVKPVKTNIVIFTLKNEEADSYLKRLEENGILGVAFGPRQVRFVTHMHFCDKQLKKVMEILRMLDKN